MAQFLDRSALDVYTNLLPLYFSSAQRSEPSVISLEIDYADLDPAVGGTRLFAVAPREGMRVASCTSAHSKR